jgi:tRNA-dihydrouridine synthase
LNNLLAVDLNFGCPNPDIIRAGAGPAMLKRRSKLEAMFASLSAWRDSSRLPVRAVGAKIRLGLNQLEMDKKVYVPVTQVSVREGCSA